MRAYAFQVSIEQAWQKAKEYYQALGNGPMYTAAILLDPRLKEAYLRREWGSA
jgi:hypothetical protein